MAGRYCSPQIRQPSSSRSMRACAAVLGVEVLAHDVVRRPQVTVGQRLERIAQRKRAGAEGTEDCDDEQAADGPYGSSASG